MKMYAYQGGILIACIVYHKNSLSLYKYILSWFNYLAF